MMRQETARLHRQMRKVARTFNELAEQVAERGSDGAAEASKWIGHGAEDVRIGLRDLEDEVVLRGRRAGRHLKRQIGRHPWSTVAAALVVAAAVAFIATRKRRG